VSGLGNMFGVQPRIGDDGLRAEALVLTSVAGPDVLSDSDGVASAYNRRWEAKIPILVLLEGRAPYHLAPRRWMTRAKYPIAGTRLPVTVDRSDASRVRIEWDDTPTIDEWIAAGHPVFSDPDAVRAALREHQKAFETVRVDDAVGPVLDGMGMTGAGDQAIVRETLARAREAAQAQVPAPPAPVITGASARILAVTPGIATGYNLNWRGEILLSVSVPGSGRRGARWTGKIYGTKALPVWGDIPIVIDGKGKVQIQWDAIPDAAAQVGDRMRADAERMRAQLAAAPVAWGAVPAVPAAPAAPDPMDQLKRLADLRDAGALTDEEFVAEKARVLDQT
jgi:Short C-terminal domain